MAKVKLKKSSNAAEAVETDAEDAEEVVEVVEEATAAEAAPEPPAVPVTGLPPAQIHEAQIKKTPKDYVKVTCLEDMEPPPTIGHFSVARELNIVKMSARATYFLPRYVAEHMEEKKKVAILE